MRLLEVIQKEHNQVVSLLVKSGAIIDTMVLEGFCVLLLQEGVCVLGRELWLTPLLQEIMFNELHFNSYLRRLYPFAKVLLIVGASLFSIDRVLLFCFGWFGSPHLCHSFKGSFLLGWRVC